MKHLVYVEDVIKAVDRHTHDGDLHCYLDDDITCILEEIPTVTNDDFVNLMNANESMRKIIHARVKYGEWREIGASFIAGSTVCECTRCGTRVVLNDHNKKDYKYCPKCGSCNERRKMKFITVMQTSLRQDGNGDFVYEGMTFDSKEEAEIYIAEHENGWVHFSDIKAVGDQK